MDKRPPGEPAEIPYEVVSRTEWGVSVANTFRYRPAFGTWMYFGSCPRCGHDTSTMIGDGMIMKYMQLAEVRPEPITLAKLTVVCQCSHQHEADKTGCGCFVNVFNVRFK